jgi:pyrimidine deaminase RibD-like protein
MNKRVMVVVFIVSVFVCTYFSFNRPLLCGLGLATTPNLNSASVVLPPQESRTALPEAPRGMSTVPSVREFLTRDGRVNLESLRASGYVGPLDLKGVGVRIERRSGELVARPSRVTGGSESPDDVYWSEGFRRMGMNEDVYALAVYDNKLIAGGWFTAAGGVGANHIAAWDGSGWSPLGSGTNSAVGALTVYDGKLIAGGYFDTAGAVAAKCVAAWDGSVWSALGSGVNNGVGALMVYDGKLIAGGYFDTAGAVAAKCVAAWNGSVWSALGSGMNCYVYALAVYDGKLIAGGCFDAAGAVAARCIAAWDGLVWSPLGSGTNS